MTKSYESRIATLEKRMIQQIPEMSVIITTVDDNTKFSIGERKYSVPEGMNLSGYLDQLTLERKIGKRRVVIYAVKPSMDGL